MRTIIGSGASIGADPEIFLARQTKRGGLTITGSEKVLPPEGVSVPLPAYAVKGTKPNAVVRDGVQVELHPRPAHCRIAFNKAMAECISLMQGTLKGHPGLKLDFSQVVKVTSREMNSLSPESQQLGCMPSMNIYGTPQLDVSGKRVLTRSGSGHIHVGLKAISDPSSKHHINAQELVKILDTVLGVPSVLIDRDPAAATRRKLYGRAGEYRLPIYGVEYRTLSNFWLRSPRLASFVTGMAKTATSICFTATLHEGYGGYMKPALTLKDELLAIDPTLIMKAINKNDFDTASKLWNDTIKPIMADVDTRGVGLFAANFDDFAYFVEKGLDHWFDSDSDSIVKEWSIDNGAGFESFLNFVVRPQRLARQ